MEFDKIRITYDKSKTDVQTFQKAQKVIIDCDTGVDDAIAIILALHLAKKHKIDILGITVADGNAPLD